MGFTHNRDLYRTTRSLVFNPGSLLLSGLFLGACMPPPTTDLPASDLNVKITVIDTAENPSDGKVPIVVQFVSNGRVVALASNATVTCNGVAMSWNGLVVGYAERVPIVAVGGTYSCAHRRNGVTTTANVTVPSRPVFVSPAQGDLVTLSKNLTIKYIPADGTGVDAGAGDGVTGIEQNIFEPDNGVYTGLDVSPLRGGPGSINLIRKFEATPSGTSFRSVQITYHSSSRITVTWQPTVDEVLARCPTAAEIASVNARLTMAFAADPTAGTLVCTAGSGSAILTRLQERAYQAVLMMSRLKFDAPLPWTSRPLSTWFTDGISGIRFRDDIQGSFCCDPPNVINVRAHTGLCALNTNRWGDPQLGGCGLRDMMVLFVHEARHNEGKPHTCGDKDNTIAELGAWGVQYYLLQWLADHSDPDFLTTSNPYPTYYSDSARTDADRIRNSSFCQP